MAPPLPRPSQTNSLSERRNAARAPFLAQYADTERPRGASARDISWPCLSRILSTRLTIYDADFVLPPPRPCSAMPYPHPISRCEAMRRAQLSESHPVAGVTSSKVIHLSQLRTAIHEGYKRKRVSVWRAGDPMRIGPRRLVHDHVTSHRQALVLASRKCGTE